MVQWDMTLRIRGSSERFWMMKSERILEAFYTIKWTETGLEGLVLRKEPEQREFTRTDSGIEALRGYKKG